MIQIEEGILLASPPQVSKYKVIENLFGVPNRTYLGCQPQPQAGPVRSQAQVCYEKVTSMGKNRCHVIQTLQIPMISWALQV